MGDAVPQTPWDLPLYRLPDGEGKERPPYVDGPSIGIAARNGARVASQRCPILHAGRGIISVGQFKSRRKMVDPGRKM
jgi:hypothetical protein